MDKKILAYLNPISHLGDTHYSFLFPFLLTIFIYALFEVLAYFISMDPSAYGVYVISLSAVLITYFSFRDGIKGGFTATVITPGYYFYIMYSRHYTQAQLTSGIETTIILSILYLILSTIIGGLKQKIDNLIEQEADEKRRLQTIIQQLPVGVLITDSKGTIIQGNKKINAIMGTKLPISLKIPLTQNGKLANPSQSPLSQALITGKPVVGKEFVLEKEDEKKTYIQVSAAPILNRHGRVIAAAEIVHDVTAQKELEQRKDDFVNMASHELKTPITSMKLYIESLLNRIKNYNDPRSKKTLHSIKEQTQKLQKLVSDLLDVSRLQTGKLTFNKEKFNLDRLLKEVINELRGTAKKQKINYLKRSSVIIYADRFRIYQIITNLITNAIKYSSNEGDINIGLRKLNGKATVSVQDFGIGIAKDQQKRIFDRLYQVNDDMGKTFPGFGMGLYISKEIIKRHRGNIWVYSEKGKGSTFYFSLPLKR